MSVLRTEAAASGLGPLAADAPPLAFGQATPDPELLAVLEGELQALLTHDAAAAHLLRLARGRAPLREEEVRVDPEAVGMVLPTVISGIGGRIEWVVHVVRSFLPWDPLATTP